MMVTGKANIQDFPYMRTLKANEHCSEDSDESDPNLNDFRWLTSLQPVQTSGPGGLYSNNLNSSRGIPLRATWFRGGRRPIYR